MIKCILWELEIAKLHHIRFQGTAETLVVTKTSTLQPRINHKQFSCFGTQTWGEYQSRAAYPSIAKATSSSPMLSLVAASISSSSIVVLLRQTLHSLLLHICKQRVQCLRPLLLFRHHLHLLLLLHTKSSLGHKKI